MNGASIERFSLIGFSPLLFLLVLSSEVAVPAFAKDETLAMAQALMEGHTKYLDSLSEGDVVADVEEVYDVPPPADTSSHSKRRVTIRGHARFVYSGGLDEGKYFCEWRQDKQLDSNQKLIKVPKDDRVAYLDDGKDGYILEIDSVGDWTELRLWPRQVLSEGNPSFHLPTLFPFACYRRFYPDWLRKCAEKKALQVMVIQGKKGPTGIFEVSYSYETPDHKGAIWQNQWTWRIDKARGCLMTHFEIREKSSQAIEAVPTLISEFRYKRYPSGLFLPQEILQTESDKLTGRRERVRKIRLSYQSIGKPIDDRFFTVNALKVPLGTPVHDDRTQPHQGWIFGEPRGAKERAELIARTAPGDAKSMLEKSVSFDFSSAPLSSVSGFLREISGLNVILDPKVAKRDPSVTLKLVEVTIQTALDWVVTLTNLDYTYHNGGIFISDAKTIQKINSEGSRTILPEK